MNTSEKPQKVPCSNVSCFHQFDSHQIDNDFLDCPECLIRNKGDQLSRSLKIQTQSKALTSYKKPIDTELVDDQKVQVCKNDEENLEKPTNSENDSYKDVKIHQMDRKLKGAEYKFDEDAKEESSSKKLKNNVNDNDAEMDQTVQISESTEDESEEEVQTENSREKLMSYDETTNVKICDDKENDVEVKVPQPLELSDYSEGKTEEDKIQNSQEKLISHDQVANENINVAPFNENGSHGAYFYLISCFIVVGVAIISYLILKFKK